MNGVIRVLFMLPHQHLHRLLWNGHLADRVFRLWLRDHQFAIRAGHLFADRDDAVLHIQVIPEERQQFPTPQAAGQFQHEHRQDTVLLRFLKVGAHLLRRDDGHLLLLLGLDAAVVTGIVRDDPFFHCLLQCAVEHHVDAPDEAVGECRVPLFFEPLYPPIGLGLVIHPLDMDGGELLDLHRTDGRDDVLLDDVFVGLGAVL